MHLTEIDLILVLAENLPEALLELILAVLVSFLNRVDEHSFIGLLSSEPRLNALLMRLGVSRVVEL